MKWVNLTDMIFCRAYDHLFVVHKDHYTNTWKVIHTPTQSVIGEGNTGHIGKAKLKCKEHYDVIKQLHKEKVTQ